MSNSSFPSPRNKTPGYKLIANASLQSLTTFHVAAKASQLIEVTQANVLPDLLAQLKTDHQPLLVLGGGSNILFTQDFAGTIIRMATRGIATITDDGVTARVQVAAGENWDAFVRWSLAQGFAGLENLILIPGTVGAAPMQNIGAYGVEVSEFIHAVNAWDHQQGQFIRLTNSDCDFAYRNSRFKRYRERYIITAVEFDLPRTRELSLDYAGVTQELAAMNINQPDRSQVGAAVERIRKRKLPDPAQLGNAGSFFKNPIVSPETVERLKGGHATLPVYKLPDNERKLSAAWLLEQVGYKGKRKGDAGFAEQHALVLINYGNASGAELWAMASEAKNVVANRFSITLEPEPLIL
ncbi:MAG TPA: UDP-N-acetylmuramate dehydrogenase [Gammaproteobacteria bacterium]|nr:UDP-N-acetylmuramate dehydrogenase [Gammaproteobacteria bacterium]